MSQIETGLRLRTARRSLGLSVARVSELAGASPSTIKRWEAGKGLPRARDLERYLASIGAPDAVPAQPEEACYGRIAQRLLRAKRRRSECTLEELSSVTGTCVASLHRYETGTRAPVPAVLHCLAKSYGCSDEEAQLLANPPASRAGSVIDRFLSPGSQPHFWLYHKLEESLRPGSEPTAEEALDLIHGFMIMGDHRGLLEAWELLRPSVARLSLSQEQVATFSLTLSLARFTVSGDKKQVRSRIGRMQDLDCEIPSNAISHLSRLMVALGDLDGAETWLNRLAYSANRNQEAGLIFVSEVSRVLLAFERTRSPKQLGALELLRNKVQGVLQAYTLDVAELHILSELGEHSTAAELLGRCEQGEETYGFGSPLAARLRSRYGQW